MKLQRYTIIALPLFFLHTLEEYYFGFIETDISIRWLSSIFDVSRASAHWTVQVLVAMYLLSLVFFRPARKVWYFILGIIFVVEIHHLWETLTSGYAPGFWTAIPLVMLGVLFWRELLITKTHEQT